MRFEFLVLRYDNVFDEYYLERVKGYSYNLKEGYYYDKNLKTWFLVDLPTGKEIVDFSTEEELLKFAEKTNDEIEKYRTTEDYQTELKLFRLCKLETIY